MYVRPAGRPAPSLLDDAAMRRSVMDRRMFLVRFAGRSLATPLGVFWFMLAVLAIVLLVRGWLWPS